MSDLEADGTTYTAAPHITIEVESIPVERRYRESFGDELSHVIQSHIHSMISPLAQSPSREKAEVVATALARWAQADPDGFDAAVWAARTHQ